MIAGVKPAAFAKIVNQRRRDLSEQRILADRDRSRRRARRAVLGAHQVATGLSEGAEIRKIVVAILPPVRKIRQRLQGGGKTALTVDEYGEPAVRKRNIALHDCRFWADRFQRHAINKDLEVFLIAA